MAWKGENMCQKHEKAENFRGCKQQWRGGGFYQPDKNRVGGGRKSIYYVGYSATWLYIHKTTEIMYGKTMLQNYSNTTTHDCTLIWWTKFWHWNRFNIKLKDCVGKN